QTARRTRRPPACAIRRCPRRWAQAIPRRRATRAVGYRSSGREELEGGAVDGVASAAVKFGDGPPPAPRTDAVVRVCAALKTSRPPTRRALGLDKRLAHRLTARAAFDERNVVPFARVDRGPYLLSQLVRVRLVGAAQDRSRYARRAFWA